MDGLQKRELYIQPTFYQCDINPIDPNNFIALAADYSIRVYTYVCTHICTYAIHLAIIFNALINPEFTLHHKNFTF